MKKFLLATAALATLAVATPATAQVGNVIRDGLANILGGSSANVGTRLNDLNLRVQASYQRGDISRTEAARLQAEIADLARRDQAYRSGGLTREENAELQQRLQQLEVRIQQASYSRDGQYNGDDRYDRDDRNDRYDRDDDDRYDRDGRYSDSDRDGRWVQADERRYGRNGCPPGLARKDNGCLPPGQAMRQGDRYTQQYARVPTSFGRQYRDSDRFIYRYDSGRIYQVDRRTGLIVRVTTVRR